MKWAFSQKSIDNFAGVHPDLVHVIMAALEASPFDFGISCGKRTKEQQIALYKSGATRTLHSRHLTGHAVDIFVLKNGKVTWDFEYYQIVADHILVMSRLMDIPVVWGGSWETFRDGPHYELDRRKYP